METESSSIQLRLTIHGLNPAYVEQRVGRFLYAHLRAMPTALTHRERALDRARGLYRGGLDSEESESRIAGLGLLVLQRAFLILEDLGALLYAFDEKPREKRLTTYSLQQLDAIYRRTVATELDVSELFRLPDSEAIANEPGLTRDERRILATLGSITKTRLAEKLRYVAAAWLARSRTSKKTMHGVGFVSGEHVFGEPGAGMIASCVDRDFPRPFAAALDSIFDHGSGHVNTIVEAVPLASWEIRRVHLAGVNAVSLARSFVDGWLKRLESQHAFTMPDTYRHELDAGDRALFERLLERD